MIKYLILFASLLLASAAAAQTQEDQILQQVRDREHAKNAAIMRKMDQGVDSMNVGSYQVAEKLFREVLKEAKVVPTDLTFYFGKNSYLLEKYQQSIDWLNKYIEIKGTSGRYYEETIQLLGYAKNAFLKIRSEERKEASQLISSSNYEIDCGPTGKVLCPVCRGEGVIIERGAFGNTYRDCPYSDDHGYLTCEEYNQLLRGELEEKN